MSYARCLGVVLLLVGCSSDPVPTTAPVAAPGAIEQPTDAGGAATTDPACAELTGELQKTVDESRATKKWAHASLAVKTPKCGTVVVFSDDPNKKDKASPDSLWRIGSVTKTFVAAATLSLAAGGELSIDDALAKFVPDFPNAANITLRQLLQHTSGVPDFFHVLSYVRAMEAEPTRAVTADEVLAIVAKEPADFAPGKRWAYSNTNYVLLGRVLEKVTGAPLAQVIRERAIDRAGLTHTFFDGAEPTHGTLIAGYEDGVVSTNKVHPSWYGAAGAIAATPSDLADWAEKLYGGDAVLGEASRKEMLSTIPTSRSRTRYGLGVMERSAVDNAGNGVGYGHSGGVFGYRTEMFYFPETKVAMSAMVADTDGDPLPLCERALEAVKIVQ